MFVGLWDEAREALERVYDTKSLKDLVDREEQMCRAGFLSYSI